MKYKETLITNKNIEIIDGDRGKNYPKKNELSSEGDTLFLNNKNLISNRLDVSIGEYISKERDNLLRKGKLIRGDIVLTTRGSIGNVGYFSERISQENIRVNSGMVIIRNKDESVYTPFLYLMLSSDFCKNQYFELSSGSVQVQLPIRDLKYLNILDIPLEKQKRIFEIIDSIDHKIELNNQMIDTLEEMASALFKRWFVDFEFPDENGNPYKSSGGKMINSELGKIPEGWEVAELSSLFNFNPRETLKKGSYATKIEMKALNDSIMIQNWAVEEFKGSGTKFRNGDTLFARITPCLENGKKGFVDMLNNNEIGFGSTEYIIIRPKDANSEYLGYFYSTLDDFRNYAIANMNGSSGRQRVNAVTLAGYKIVKPTKNYLEKLNNILEPIVKQMTAYRNEIIALTGTRDVLLPKLLSGELEV